VRTKRGGEIRRAFVAAPGHLLLIADYSQVDCGCSRTSRTIRRSSRRFSAAAISTANGGGDLRRPGGKRDGRSARAPKPSTFATSMAGGWPCRAKLGITLEEAEAFIRHYFERFAGVRAGSTDGR